MVRADLVHPDAILQLAQRAGNLKDKGIVVVAAQGTRVEEAKLKEWAEQNAHSLPVGHVQGSEARPRFTWAVRSLPWLILQWSSAKLLTRSLRKL
jgi:hypothetical protein